MDRKCLRYDSLCTDLRGELARAEGEDETEHWISSKCLKKKNKKYSHFVDNIKLPEDGLCLASDLLLRGGGREVGELVAPARELVLGLEGQGLGLHDLLGDSLDADILVESHLARLGHTGVLRPQAR